MGSGEEVVWGWDVVVWGCVEYSLGGGKLKKKEGKDEKKVLRERVGNGYS